MKNIVWSIQAIVLAAGILFSACDETLEPSDDTVMIGNQEWTTRSLDVDTFRNGDPIPEVRSAQEWFNANEERRPAWCYYNNDPGNGDLYGRLYNFYAVIDPRGLAPDGWHVSTQSEWQAMFNDLGADAADKLKSDRLWVEDLGGNNNSGFSALPGSGRWRNGGFVDNPFYTTGHAVLFWTSSGLYYVLSRGLQGYGWGPEQEGGVGAYVRCVRGAEDELFVSIGEQFWKAENLNVDTFRNGEEIPYAPTMEAWASASAQKRPAWCYYLNDPDNGPLYGRLYNWYAVTDPRSLAPVGMHIPDALEWMALAQHLTDNGLDGNALKSVIGWNTPVTWGANSTSFTALPGQMRFETGVFYEGPQLALFWSTDEIDAQTATARGLHGDVGNFSNFFQNKGAGLSVRCLRD